MLPKDLRLSAAAIRRVKKLGRNERGRFFLVSQWRGIVGANRESLSLFRPRFAFVVAKRLDKRAVVRNRVRRRLSEAVRLFVKGRLGSQITNLTGKDPGSIGSLEICFIARQPILGASYEEISFEVNQVLSRLFEL